MQTSRTRRGAPRLVHLLPTRHPAASRHPVVAVAAVTRPMLRTVPPQPVCCDSGADLGACPEHDTWRTPRFEAPPATDSDEEEDQQWQ